jgi:hypothetical protein
MIRKAVGTVGTLAHEAVSTAVSVAKHPIGSASVAVGFAKGIAGASIDLVRGGGTDVSSPAAAWPASDEAVVVTAEPDVVETHEAPETPDSPETAEAPETQETPGDPRDDIPGPDLAQFEPPSPDDLPEPIVIEAEPSATEEAFHTEPKAASRDSDHGGLPGDREEIDGYVEEIPTDDVDIETPVGTTGADVGFNPDTAEADLQQPDTPPLLDPGTLHAIESESEILRKAADEKPE